MRIPSDHKSITLCEHFETDDGRGGVYSTQVFSFDYAYDQNARQKDVYERSAQPAVLSVLEGRVTNRQGLISTCPCPTSLLRSDSQSARRDRRSCLKLVAFDDQGGVRVLGTDLLFCAATLLLTKLSSGGFRPSAATLHHSIVQDQNFFRDGHYCNGDGASHRTSKDNKLRSKN